MHILHVYKWIRSIDTQKHTHAQANVYILMHWKTCKEMHANTEVYCDDEMGGTEDVSVARKSVTEDYCINILLLINKLIKRRVIVRVNNSDSNKEEYIHNDGGRNEYQRYAVV